jgi:hypothetical protein
MPANDGRSVLEIVNLVVGDLRLRDRMFTARRPDPERPDHVVIQTGEEGRHALPTPSLAEPRTLNEFITAAQAHLHDVYGQPVPCCPLHDHALLTRLERGAIEWVCPEGTWSCPLGDYEESTWPPALAGGPLAAALCARLTRRSVTGVHTLGCDDRDGHPVFRVGIWPMSAEIIDAVTRAADPIPIKFEPREEIFFIRVAESTSTKARSGSP